jgi:O-succinylbenzoate synthase
VDLLLGLAGDYPVTVALDESVLGEADFTRWRDLGWPGVFVIKPALWGDPEGLIEAVRATGTDVVVSSALETRIGASITLAVAFALGAQARAAGVGVWPLFADSAHDGPAALPFLKRETVLGLGSSRSGGEA